MRLSSCALFCHLFRARQSLSISLSAIAAEAANGRWTESGQPLAQIPPVDTSSVIPATLPHESKRAYWCEWRQVGWCGSSIASWSVIRQLHASSSCHEAHASDRPPQSKPEAGPSSERLHSSSRQQPTSRLPAGRPSEADRAGKAYNGATVKGKSRVPGAVGSRSSRPVHKEDSFDQSHQTRQEYQADQQAEKILTNAIKRCSSLDTLQEVLGPHLQQGEMNEYHINAAWGQLAKLIATAGRQDAEAHHVIQLGDQLADVTLAKLEGLGTRQAGNIVHALGTLRLRPANGLLAQLLGRLMAGDGAMLRQATPQQLSNMAWSLSRLVPLHQDEQTGLWRIAEVTVSRLRLQGATEAADFKPQEISNLVIAYAKAGLSAAAGGAHAVLLEDLFNELMQAATRCLRKFEPQGLANLLWGVATVHSTPIYLGFMAAWAQATRQAARRFNVQNIANSLWALAELRFYDPSLIRDLLFQANKNLRAFKAQELANSLLALAKLQHREEAAVATMLAAVQGRLHEFNTQELGNTLWALAVLKFSRNATVIEGLLQQLAAQDARKLTVEECTQVWQAWCWYNGNVDGGQTRLRDCPKLLRMIDQCQPRAKAHMASLTRSSQAQQEIAPVLRAVLADSRAAGLEVVQKQQHPVTHQVVDIVLLRPGGAWAAAVEVDSEWHYAVNKPGHLLGSAVLRDGLLQAQGLPVVTILSYEWKGQKGEEAQKQYLRTKLAGLLAAAVVDPTVQR